MDEQQETGSRIPISKDAPEVRVKLTRDLYQALHREAAVESITVAALLRRILTRHYERVGESVVEQVRVALAEASAERELVIAMLDLLYQGLLVRLAKPCAAELEVRIAEAAEGHRKWRAELARRLADGSTDALLALIRNAGREASEKAAVDGSSA